MCVLKEEKQRGWESYIVKNEGLVTADWFSLGWWMFFVFLWGRDEAKGSRTREPEMKGACNTLLIHHILFSPVLVTGMAQ